MKKYKIYLILLVIFSFTYVAAQFDYITVPPGSDPSISAEDGGNGFEEIAESLGYQTANFTDEDLKYFGDSKAIKGGTLRTEAARYPPSLRTFGNLFYFSVVVFSTVGFGEITPLGFLNKTVMIFEGIAGGIIMSIVMIAVYKHLMDR